MRASTDGRRVVLRADGGAAIGLGHVMRSLTLGRELADAGWSVTFCGSGLPDPGTAPSAIEVVATTPVADAAAVLRLAPDLVVVDGYHFTAEFFAALERHGVPHVVIDDNGDTPARRPIAVVNQNPHASEDMYGHLDGQPLLLLGLEYALVRREVVAAARERGDRRPGRVFVGFGGSDPCGLTEPVARALAASDLEVVVAIGPAHPDRAAVVAALDDERITVAEPSEYVAALAGSAVAVLGAGSSIWESRCLGVPTVAVVVADNQLRPATSALEQGLVHAVLPADDRLLDALPATVAGLAGAEPPDAAPSCDGARRVAAALAGLPTARVELRAATVEDAEFLFALRTDPEVDRHSFGPAPTWPDHLDWLRATLADDRSRLMIAEQRGEPVGQVRLDRGDAEDELSIALVEQRRGCGLGPLVIEAASALADGDVVARIATGNERSIAAFGRAGFFPETGSGGGADEVVVLRRARRPAS